MLFGENFSGIDVVVIALYFAATMAIGALAIRKGRSVDAYIAAERSLPGWLTGLSILGSFVSSISFLGYPGKSFAADWNPFVFGLAMPAAIFIAVKFFIPFYRQCGSVSAYEHFERRFGPWARIYAGVCFLLTQLARMGAVTYLMALPMSVLLGWDIYVIIIITGVVVTLYTFAGGIVAVIWTEAVQTVVLIGGALLCAIMLTAAAPGGFEGIVETGMAKGKFSLGSFDFSFASFAENTFWVVLMYGLFINLQNFGIDQNYVQRYITAKSDADARRSVWYSGVIFIPLSAVFFYIGTALFCYYGENPGLLPAEYAAKTDYVFPYYIVSELPVGVKGLLIAAIFAAAMSTVSCSLNSSATILLTDYYQRYFGKNATQKQSMRFLHVSTIVWGLLGTLIALAFTKAESALDAFWTLAGIFGGGMLGLFLLGMMCKRAGSAAGLVGVGTGLLFIAWMTLSRKIDCIADSPFHGFMIPVLGTSAVFLFGFGAAQFFGRNKNASKKPLK